MSVCDGSRVFDEQADPVEIDIPLSFNDRSSASPSIPSNLKCTLFGNLSTGWPLRYALGISFEIFSIKISRNSLNLFTYSSISFCIISTAFCIPTIPGIFSVPERKPFSWPPPMITGLILIPFLTYKTPTPFGP